MKTNFNMTPKEQYRAAKWDHRKDMARMWCEAFSCLLFIFGFPILLVAWWHQ